jgi:tight adherence protein B
MRPRLIGPASLVGGVLMACFVGGAYMARAELHALFSRKPAALPAVILASAGLMIALSGILSLEGTALRRSWLRRTAQVTGLEGLKPLSLWALLSRRFPDPLEWLLGPFLRTRPGRRLAEEWLDARLGGKPSRYLVLMGVAVLAGGVFGSRVGGPVLSLALAILAPLLPRQIVRRRAEANRRRFGEQLPQALDSFAAGLAAGLSFQQAVAYAREELPSPVVDVFARLSRRMDLGHPVETALQSLLEEQPDESLALVVDGVVLQRKFGGDMVRMLDETADLLRQRVELEREVRAVTTQGRLSGMIIAGLMPVSAAILLSLNPRYIDVLFNTLIGQVLLVIALLLQLIGWAIISRLVRIRY